MLHDALVSNLNFHAVDGFEVAYVSGTLQRATDAQSKLPLLHPLAAEEVQGHHPVNHALEDPPSHKSNLNQLTTRS